MFYTLGKNLDKGESVVCNFAHKYWLHQTKATPEYTSVMQDEIFGYEKTVSSELQRCTDC